MIGRHNRDYRQCGQLASVKLARKQSALLSNQGNVDFSFAVPKRALRSPLSRAADTQSLPTPQTGCRLTQNLLI
jgi:hypothetical protein